MSGLLQWSPISTSLTINSDLILETFPDDENSTGQARCLINLDHNQKAHLRFFSFLQHVAGKSTKMCLDLCVPISDENFKFVDIQSFTSKQGALKRIVTAAGNLNFADSDVEDVDAVM